MTLSADDLDRLEQAAKAASCGPWEVFSTEDITVHQVETQAQICHVGVEDDELIDGIRADAAYIAAANPSVTLALLAEIRELRARRSCYGRAFDVFNRWRQTVTGDQPGFSHQDGLRFERMLQEAFAPAAPATEPER